MPYARKFCYNRQHLNGTYTWNYVEMHFASVSISINIMTSSKYACKIEVGSNECSKALTTAMKTITITTTQLTALYNNNNSHNVFSVVSTAYWRFTTVQINSNKSSSIALWVRILFTRYFIFYRFETESEIGQSLHMENGFLHAARAHRVIDVCCTLSPHFIAKNWNLLEYISREAWGCIIISSLSHTLWFFCYYMDETFHRS